MSLRYSIQTLGCKVNQIDSAAICDLLESTDYRRVEFGQPADLVVINTCAVTARADRQGRQWVSRARAAFPDATIVVTGCSPETSQAPSAYPDADVVCGNLEKADLLDLIDQVRRFAGRIERIQSPQSDSPVEFGRPRNMPGRTRSFLKVQEGCCFACAYCIVPAARGPSRSLPYPDVEARFGALVKSGYREIVLSGIHLGAWGIELSPRESIVDLVDRLSAAFSDVRIRLSSIEPREIDDRLIALLQDRENLCRHLHIPLQSGSNEILALMNRNYDAQTYADLVERIADRVEGVTIGADLIVGFPQESQAHFEATQLLVARLPLSHFHVFPFSIRPNTKAATMPGHIGADQIKRRAAILRALDREKRTAHYRRFLGQSLDVLCEGQKSDGRYGGMSDNYIPVRFEQTVGEGALVTVEIESITEIAKGPGLLGKVVKSG